MAKYEFIKINDAPIYSNEFQELAKGDIHSKEHKFPNLTENERDVLREIVFKEGLTYRDFTIYTDPSVLRTMKVKKVTTKNGAEMLRPMVANAVTYYFYEPELEKLEAFKQGTPMKEGRYRNGVIMVRADKIIGLTEYLVSIETQGAGENKEFVPAKVIKELKRLYELKHGGPTHFVKERILNREAKKQNQINTAVIEKQSKLEKDLLEIPGAIEHFTPEGSAEKEIYIPIAECVLPKTKRINENIKSIFKSYPDLLSLLLDLYKKNKLHGDITSNSDKTRKEVIEIIKDFDKQKKLHPVLKYILSLCE